MYARTKLEGERAAAGHPKHLIVRTCGLYARASDARATNFVKTMLRLGGAGQRREVRVVADQHCTPTYVPHLAQALLFLLDHGGSSVPWGTYHVTNAGATTWHGFAAEIFHRAGLPVAVRPITTAEYGAPPRVPPIVSSTRPPTIVLAAPPCPTGAGAGRILWSGKRSAAGACSGEGLGGLV